MCSWHYLLARDKDVLLTCEAHATFTSLSCLGVYCWFSGTLRVSGTSPSAKIKQTISLWGRKERSENVYDTITYYQAQVSPQQKSLLHTPVPQPNQGVVRVTASFRSLATPGHHTAPLPSSQRTSHSSSLQHCPTVVHLPKMKSKTRSRIRTPCISSPTPHH